MCLSSMIADEKMLKDLTSAYYEPCSPTSTSATRAYRLQVFEAREKLRSGKLMGKHAVELKTTVYCAGVYLSQNQSASAVIPPRL